MGSMPEMEIPMAAKSNGRATILAIGTANPPNEFPQVDFADYYFRITNSDFSSPLYSKFKRLCEKSRIRKRHLHAAEEVFKKHPEICDPEAPASLTARQGILATEIPELGKEAAEKAIKEWGQPKSNITHVIFATNSFADTPAPDQYLVMLLGLSPWVERVVLRQVGCHAGATLIRTAKSIAENYSGARVLVVCADMSSVISFQYPAETNLLVHALFSDGAAAMIVGADPTPDERPIFELVSARQSTIPDTEPAIQLRLREEGLVGHVHPKVPIHLANNIENVLLESFRPLGVVDDWNSIFWVPHPGGPAILDKIEDELKLEPSKLNACRKTLTEYGNMWGSTVIFALDEMRNNSVKQGKTTTGDGLDLGVLFGFGPGVTVETVVLQSVQLH